MNTDHDFAEFVSSRWTSLYRLAYLLAASDSGAEDLLQTTLEKAYVHWGRIARMEFPEAYVRRMLANTLVSSRRRAWLGERPTADLPEVAHDSDELPVLDRSILWPLVCALPERQRAVIVLRYYEDLAEAEIAATLGCAPGTVKSQSSAAMKALRRALAASGIGEAVSES
jgi:RNA polymerase sigma-70 factor (sigma-E family)